MNWQTIMKIAAEGGTITLEGRQLRNRSWRFRVMTNEPDFIEEFFTKHELKELHSARSGIFREFQDAIAMLDDTYGSWANFYPLEVNPDFRDHIAVLVKERCPAIAQLSEWECAFRGTKHSEAAEHAKTEDKLVLPHSDFFFDY